MTTWVIMRDLGFVLAALIYAFCVAAGTLYYARFRSAAREGMAGRRKGTTRKADFQWVGALPAHVWLSCVAVALWLVPLTGLLIARYDHAPSWWGMPFVISGEFALLAALWSVTRYELRLIR